jgi:type I restriction enzyme, S subunit
MEVKSGFKLTELGIIPDDWRVHQLSKNFQIYAGGDVPKHSLSKSRSEIYKYPIYANALQQKGLYGFTSERRGKAGSLTITARGNLGHAEYREEDFFPIVRLLVLEPTGILDAQFTTFVINERVKFALESTGVPQLTSPQVKKYSVAAPKLLSEQHAIVLTLNDVEALLDQLDKLILKKRYLKQSAMQQLLTGNTRLQGFSEKWIVKKLSSIVSHFTTGKLDANAMNPKGQYRFYTCAKKYYWIDKYAFDDEALLISGNGANVGYIHYYKGKFNAYQRTYVLTGFNINVNFLKHYLDKNLSERIKIEVNAGNTPYITMGTLTDMVVKLPKSFEEQAAIASVLMDIDTEINSLKAYRDKTNILKQGMMQELLTGKTRLV